MRRTDLSPDNLFLQYLCHPHSVLMAIVMTEAFVIIIALMHPLSIFSYLLTEHKITTLMELKSYFFTPLINYTLFAQCIVMLTIGLLFLFRRSLRKFSHYQMVTISYFICIFLTLLLTELNWWFEDSQYLYTTDVDKITHIMELLKFHIPIVIGMLFLLLAGVHFGLWRKNMALIMFLFTLIASFVLAELASLSTFPLYTSEFMSTHLLILLRNIMITTIISGILLRYFYVHFHWYSETESYTNTRIQALQARIRPHFLFNSLNTIASLIRFEPSKAEEATEDLAELFRASLQDHKNLITLAEEYTLCCQYIRIEHLRFEKRLNVIWNFNNVPQDAHLPPLCLQPLIENAIYHGIQPLPAGGTIHITGLFDGQQIKLEIESPLADNHSSQHKGNRIAQKNIQQRLQACYGDRARLKIMEHKTNYRVSLYFPYI